MLSTKPTRQMRKTLFWHVPAERTAKTTTKAPSHTNIGQRTKGEDGRVLPQELLDDGQGKSTTTSDDDPDDSIDTDTGGTASNSDMDISTTRSTMYPGDNMPHQAVTGDTDYNNLLRPPLINATGDRNGGNNATTVETKQTSPPGNSSDATGDLPMAAAPGQHSPRLSLTK